MPGCVDYSDMNDSSTAQAELLPVASLSSCSPPVINVCFLFLRLDRVRFHFQKALLLKKPNKTTPLCLVRLSISALSYI